MVDPDDHEIEIEIPKYFTCPISLQIMRDPVTAITGITYDRGSIEQWLFSAGNSPTTTTCPVTKQPLPPHSDLTPNHTLRRLIQSWCAENSLARIPTPKPPLDRPQILALIKDLNNHSSLLTVKRLEALASENERNRKYMVESGVIAALLGFVSGSCHRRNRTEGLGESLSTLLKLVTTLSTMENNNNNNNNNNDIEMVVDCFTWILGSDEVESHVREIGVHVLKSVMTCTAMASPSDLSRLKPEFLSSVVGVLTRVRSGSESHAPTQRRVVNAAVQIILRVGPYRNQAGLIRVDAISELIEVELNNTGDRKMSELVFAALHQLCCMADGRARLVGHRGGVALVAWRIMRVSPAVDESAVMILSSLCRFSGTKALTREMVDVGAVEKLCCLVQVGEYGAHLKEMARKMLKAHALEWKDSPCIVDRFHYPI